MTLPMILAIDPGSEQSAWVLYAEGRPYDWAIVPNAELLTVLRGGALPEAQVVVIERVESYGMPVGREVFDTVRWEGRFQEAAEAHGIRVDQLARRYVKVHVCGDTKAKDSNIRAALIERYGGSTAIRKGGVLHGIAKDVWSALAIAVTWSDEAAGGIR